MHGVSTVLDRLEVIGQRWPRDVGVKGEIRLAQDLRDNLIALYGISAQK